MEPEEADPALLVGRHVVEVGVRQAWPFVTIADHRSGREVRLYVDSWIRLFADRVALRQDDASLLAALAAVNMLTVTSARVADGELQLEFEDVSVRVDGVGNHLTGGSSWWIGVQQP